MYIESLLYTQDEADDLNKKNDEVSYQTKLAFLRTHKGIRNFKMHLLIAPTHGGKSTAVRSILFDIITNNKNKKILIWLTEETIEEFKTSFAKTFPSHKILDNVTLVSEQNGEPSDDEVKENISEAVKMTNCDLLFCDNLTTSKIYPSGNFAKQEQAATWLKRLSKKVTTFLIAHTNSAEFNNRLLNELDIRGGKDIINLTEFLYIIQPINVKENLIQFVFLKKHRGQDAANKYFRLYYNPVLAIFDKDIAVDFNAVKEIFKERNQLVTR